MDAPVQMVPLTEILKSLTGSVDIWECLDEENHSNDGEFCLICVFRDKTGDTSFWSLCDIILDEGFTVPVCIQRLDDCWIMGNGHHRLSAAFFLGLDEIPVVFSSTVDYMMREYTDEKSDAVYRKGIHYKVVAEMYDVLWS